MFMVLPAAVLFATVFSIGSFTRHAELTAAKASGISFYRMILPVFLGAILACGLDLALGDVAPITNQRRSQLLQEDKEKIGSNRYNFAFAGEYGRVYKAYELRPDSGRIRNLQIERKGSGPKYPTYLLTADSATLSREHARPHAVDARQGRAERRQRHRAEFHDRLSRGARQSLHRAPDRDDDQVARSAQHALSGHHAVHHGDRAIGRRRQPVARRAGAQDRGSRSPA